MFGSDPNANLAKTIEMSGEFEDDPSLSMFMIYGKEGGGTTSLALSILEVIPEDKKVYTLLTEMPHNFSGVLAKHFPVDHMAQRVVVPTTESHDGTRVPRPISSLTDFMMWRREMIQVREDGSFHLKKDDCGALLVDALDTLRNIFKAHYDQKAPNKGSLNYVDADNDIIDKLFLPFSFQGIPIVVILKHKQETDWINDDFGNLMKVERHKNPDGSPKMVPTIDGDKIMRWGTIRLWCKDKVGTYEVMKTKGMVDEGTILNYGYDGHPSNRTGVWLKELIEMMKNNKPSSETVISMEM